MHTEVKLAKQYDIFNTDAIPEILKERWGSIKKEFEEEFSIGLPPNYGVPPTAVEFTLATIELASFRKAQVKLIITTDESQFTDDEE